MLVLLVLFRSFQSTSPDFLIWKLSGTSRLSDIYDLVKSKSESYTAKDKQTDKPNVIIYEVNMKRRSDHKNHAFIYVQ